MAAQRTTYYIEGNTVRKAQPAYEQETPREAVRAAKTQKARAVSRVRNFSYLAFLTISLALAGAMLFYYIMLQTQISGSADRISALERRLGTLTKENDENYNRINGNIDLEEIRRIAIQEYGMRYVEEGQIVTYSDGGGADYVRQRAEIPDAGD